MSVTCLGITHWEGEEVESTEGTTYSRPRRKYPKTLKGWFYLHAVQVGIAQRQGADD